MFKDKNEKKLGEKSPNNRSPLLRKRDSENLASHKADLSSLQKENFKEISKNYRSNRKRNSCMIIFAFC